MPSSVNRRLRSLTRECLIALQNGGACNYAAASLLATFNDAGCTCTGGWSGQHCTDDDDGCASGHCYTGDACAVTLTPLFLTR